MTSLSLRAMGRARKPSDRWSEPSTSYLNQRLAESRDAQPMLGGCALCPEWQAEGTAKEVREAQARHRQERHPETFRRKSKSRKSPYSRHMTAEREAEIEEDRKRRMRELGINEPATE